MQNASQEIRPYLSLKLSLAAGTEGVVRFWGIEGVTLFEGVLKENAEGAEGASDGGLALANVKPEAPEPKGADEPKEKAGGAELPLTDGKEKVKADDDDDDDEGAVATRLKGGAADEELATEVTARFGMADGRGAADLEDCIARETEEDK